MVRILLLLTTLPSAFFLSMALAPIGRNMPSTREYRSPIPPFRRLYPLVRVHCLSRKCDSLPCSAAQTLVVFLLSSVIILPYFPVCERKSSRVLVCVLMSWAEFDHLVLDLDAPRVKHLPDSINCAFLYSVEGNFGIATE